MKEKGCSMMQQKGPGSLFGQFHRVEGEPGIALFPRLSRATLLALTTVNWAVLTCCLTIPWSYMPSSSNGSRPPPKTAFCFDKLLAVSTKANSQSSLPDLAAGVCQAEVTSGSPLEGNASHKPFPLLAGGPANRANTNVLP
ncbi:hypothetical protein EUGRSUZ_C04111 [Eucalyptus grandis]|uniref:Uncharacterized protein n=2 Tax=Eucalyptus grandis TaxID=71139 RepID=A0A059CW71_EUCGR|nr:hypothetical protein EUGRSUZ_C04111 [Eucalyptus grandis]